MTQDEPLREDVRLLGDLLGLTLRQQAGEDIFATVERIRQLGKAAFAGDTQATANLNTILRELPTAKLLPVTKAFSQFLNFANIAEQYHRIRRLRDGSHAGSLADAIPKLLDRGIVPDKIYDAICNLDINLVLTSHPTEVKRRTVMRKYNRISRALEKLDRQVLTADEINNVTQDIHSEMTAVWRTPEVRTQKPTPLDEAKWSFAIIESSIWSALPEYIRGIERAVNDQLGYSLPLDVTPIKIDSWLGGDRDGNPNVTPEVTRKVVYMARWVAADLLLLEIARLRDALSFSPYSELLKKVRTRLRATRLWARDNIQAPTPAKDPIYLYKHELLEPLMQCYQGLLDQNADVLAHGLLTDLIRQVHCFGMHLVRTDIREEAAKHTELMAVITNSMGVGDYVDWSEQQRADFLTSQLQQPVAPLNAQVLANHAIQDTLLTFKVLQEIPRDSLGVYIISMTAQPSDVLAVMFLQRVFGIQELLPVVPLFETYADLQNAAKVLNDLLANSVYKSLINDYQQVMIGYSDSAKDVGMLAAAWAQYCAQEQMLAIAKKHTVKLVFFHGRGGSIGRGGWPTYQAIISQPPGSINGAIRITQQGEMINNRFGLKDIAIRTCSVYTSSILEADLLPPPVPLPQWRVLMDEMSVIAANEYELTIKHDPNFIKYFQQVTPTNELKELAIGSRPSARNNADSLSKLRAIPWVFAWTQNRLLLPSWAGIGAALESAVMLGKVDKLHSMCQDWPFFHNLISMFEMILAKAEVNIAQLYAKHLGDVNSQQMGESLCLEFAKTQSIILQVLQQDRLLANNYVLHRSIKLRNPYLLPLHLLQVELLYRVRDGKHAADQDLKQALLTSVAGIAAGMRNTG